MLRPSSFLMSVAAVAMFTRSTQVMKYIAHRKAKKTFVAVMSRVGPVFVAGMFTSLGSFPR
jgi:hypothetical protein